jgi:hypothetical protein
VRICAGKNQRQNNEEFSDTAAISQFEAHVKG